MKAFTANFIKQGLAQQSIVERTLDIAMAITSKAMSLVSGLVAGSLILYGSYALYDTAYTNYSASSA